jgi:hypothetical protein
MKLTESRPQKMKVLTMRITEKEAERFALAKNLSGSRSRADLIRRLVDTYLASEKR